MDTATFTERLVVAQWADVTGNVPKQQSTGGATSDHRMDEFCSEYNFAKSFFCCQHITTIKSNTLFRRCVGESEGYVKGV